MELRSYLEKFAEDWIRENVSIADKMYLDSDCFLYDLDYRELIIEKGNYRATIRMYLDGIRSTECDFAEFVNKTYYDFYFHCLLDVSILELITGIISKSQSTKTHDISL